MFFEPEAVKVLTVTSDLEGALKILYFFGVEDVRVYPNNNAYSIIYSDGDSTDAFYALAKQGFSPCKA